MGGITHEARKLAQYAIETMHRGNLGQYRVTGYLEDYGAWLAVMVIGNLWPPIVMAQVVLDREIEELQPTPFPGGLFLLFDTWIIEASPKFKSAKPLASVDSWTIEEKPSIIPDGIRFASNCCSNPAEPERTDYVASLLRTLPDPANNIEGGRTYFCGAGGMPLFDLTEIFGLRTDGYTVQASPDDRYCYPMWIGGKACLAFQVWQPEDVTGYVFGVPAEDVIAGIDAPPIVDPDIFSTITTANGLSSYALLDLDRATTGSGKLGNACHQGYFSFYNHDYTTFGIDATGEHDSLTASIVEFTVEGQPNYPRTDTGTVSEYDYSWTEWGKFPDDYVTATFEYACWDPPTPVEWNATLERYHFVALGSRVSEQGVFSISRDLEDTFPYTMWPIGSLLEKDATEAVTVYKELERFGTHKYLSEPSADTRFTVTDQYWTKGACSSLLGLADANITIKTKNDAYSVTRTITVDHVDYNRTLYKDYVLGFVGSLGYDLLLTEINRFAATTKTTSSTRSTSVTPYNTTLNITLYGNCGGFLQSSDNTKTKEVSGSEFNYSWYNNLDQGPLLVCYKEETRPIVGPAWPTTTFSNLAPANLFFSAQGNSNFSLREIKYIVSVSGAVAEELPAMDPYGYMEAFLLTPATTDKSCVFVVRSITEDPVTYDYVADEYGLYGYYEGSVTNLTGFLSAVPELKTLIEQHCFGPDYYSPEFFNYDYDRPYAYRPGIALRAKANV